VNFSKFPFDDGSNVPLNATPAEKRNAKTNYKLYITLFNQKLSIPIFTEMKQFLTKDEVEINASKVFYFFSTETSNIKQILRNEEVDFRIVLNDKWNEPLAACKTTCFSCYEENVKEKPMTSRIVLNFFSEYIKHFKCQAFIGLKNDGAVQTENLNMFCYKLPNPIYITDLDYYTYHSMPNDWYELYIPPDTKIEDDANYDIEKKIDDIIRNLEGEDKKKAMKHHGNSSSVKKEKKVDEEDDEDKVYDPYELLVQVQNKNDIINKIESLPIVVDKEFLEQKQEKKKERPSTAKLNYKFNFVSYKNEYKAYLPKKEYNMKKTRRIEKEKERRKQQEEKKRIQEMDKDQIDELLYKMNKEFDMMESKH
jgi:hypothetical protein